MKREPVVLFSSCDGNYIKFIPTLLMSASEYMSAYPLEFYLLHSSIVQEELEKVDRFCRKINISFHAVQIADESDLFAASDYLITSRVAETVRYTCIADKFGVKILSGADLPGVFDPQQI